MSLLYPKDHAEFNKLTSSSKLTVVDFWATWCGPCKAIGPKFEALPKQFPNAQFVKVDVDELQDIAGACGIRAMPTIQYYIKGSKVGEVVGADWGQIESLVQKHYKAGDVWGSAGSGHTLGGGGGSTAAEPAAGGASGGGLLSGISSYIWGSSKPAANVTEDEELQAALAASLEQDSTSSDAPAKLPPSGKSSEIQFKLPDGSTLRNVFDTHDTLEDVRRFVLSKTPGLKGKRFTVATTYPKKEYAEGNHATLEEEKLAGRVQLVVIVKN